MPADRPCSAGGARQRALAALSCVVCMAAMAGCTSLLGADATPVPGAAATLTRSERTPIPTPLRTPAASPSASPGSSRLAVAASPSASPGSSDQPPVDDDASQIQRRMQQIVSSQSMAGIESLLLDHVSLSTAQGGSVLDSSQTVAWLRDHAAGGITVTRVEQSSQTPMLVVLTEGWPSKAPIDHGQVNFSLRRYDAAGRPDEDSGEWKIDVIDAE